MNITNILLRHNYVFISDSTSTATEASKESIATVMMNLLHYGYTLNEASYNALCKLDDKSVIDFWASLETELREITGDNRNIGDFVVYKNFPAEVLSKTEAEYWIPQILMYCGFPKEFFTEEVVPRPAMKEAKKAIVLRLAKPNTISQILNSYLASPARWKDIEYLDVLYLANNVNFSLITFKENLVRLASHFIQNNIFVKMNSATDVLRLAAGLSDGDISLREDVEFKSFSKPVRRYLLKNLEECKNLSEDFARRPEVWKRLIHQLHPGDYKNRFPNVLQAMDGLYKGRLKTFNSEVERLIKDKNTDVFELLSMRPGDFSRRLLHMVRLFNAEAINAFSSEMVLNKLTVYQIASLYSYLRGLNARNYRVFPPRGNWSKVKIEPNKTLDNEQVHALVRALKNNLVKRIPKVKILDENSRRVKLPNNGGDTGMYARGTSFPIPSNVKFIRTASYWKHATTAWFDNGWNFFDKNWNAIGACAWNAAQFPGSKNPGAIFSGDPVNSKEMQCRAAQLIDIYPQELRNCGVRYAIWNVLCYSGIPFSQSEVYAVLQWGENPEEGKLFEPSRAQLSFPLTGNHKTKYVCLLDLETNEMIYLDANLNGQTSSAARNNEFLKKTMPAFMEYIDSIPSVHDLFSESVDEKSNVAILYSDKDVMLKDDTLAYVFRPENKNNKYTVLDLASLLGK